MGFASVLEPSWRKAARQYKSHSMKISKIEKEERDAIDMRKRTRTQLKKKIIVEAAEYKVAREAIKEKEPTAVIARELKVDEEISQRAKDIEAFLERRRREAEEADREKLEKIRREEDEKARALKERRDFAEKYWSSKSVEYRGDLHEIRRTRDDETERRLKQAVDQDREEIKRRSQVRVEEQSRGPSISTKVNFPSGKKLGIFSTPLGDGDYNSEYR